MCVFFIVGHDEWLGEQGWVYIISPLMVTHFWGNNSMFLNRKKWNIALYISPLDTFTSPPCTINPVIAISKYHVRPCSEHCQLPLQREGKEGGEGERREGGMEEGKRERETDGWRNKNYSTCKSWVSIQKVSLVAVNVLCLCLLLLKPKPWPG